MVVEGVSAGEGVVDMDLRQTIKKVAKARVGMVSGFWWRVCVEREGDDGGGGAGGGGGRIGIVENDRATSR